MPARLRFSAAAAYRHLRNADPVVARLIDAHGPYRPRPGGDPYAALIRTILFQQLSGTAAEAIRRKWLALYSDEGRVPTPTEILATTDEAFRSTGVSRQKAGYLRDFATRIVDGQLDLEHLDALSDEEIIERVTAVKGLGEWSAHMFLMFNLGRPDVLPTGDLGVRNGMQVAYALPAHPTPTQAQDIGAAWAPYRSVGSWYMWRAVETVLPD